MVASREKRQEKRCVHAVSNNTKGEDCHGEGIAAVKRVAAKQLGDGLVVVLCKMCMICQFFVLSSLFRLLKFTVASVSCFVVPADFRIVILT